MNEVPVRDDTPLASLSLQPVVANATTLSTKRARPRARAPRNWPAARLANKALVLAALRKHQVCLATMHYSGQGDEGSPAEVSFFTDEDGQTALSDSTEVALSTTSIWTPRPEPSQPEHKAKHFVKEAMTLEAAVEFFGWEAVEHLHGGFWNGSGGEGEVRFHPAAGTVVVCHDDFITESLHTETRL